MPTFRPASTSSSCEDGSAELLLRTKRQGCGPGGPRSQKKLILPLLLLLPYYSFALPKPTPRPLAVDELRLEVAEAQYKLKQTGSTISELVAVLEKEIRTRCFTGMFKSLAYAGSPTDPVCLARLERLTSLQAENPVAVCAKEGIDSPNCKSLFSKQIVLVYDSSQDGSKDLLDPTMRLGYTTKELSNLEALRTKTLALQEELNTAKTPENLTQLRGIYEEMLRIGCRPTSERLIEKDNSINDTEDSEITQVREKLLAIPVNLRHDYQQEMLQQYEKRSREHAGDEKEQQRILRLLKVIADPDKPLAKSIGDLERTRFIMPECYKLIQSVSNFDSRLPAPLCHYLGWYTPQCIDALRKWRAAQIREKAPNKSEKDQVIGTF